MRTRLVNRSKIDVSECATIARQIRGELVAMSHRTGAPHLGSSLSCVDILVAAYWAALRINPSNPLDSQRDRFILSKGHSAAALYATLAYRGFFPRALLESYTRPASRLPEHPIAGCVPGVEVTSGSLGHGLSMGAGMALSSRILQANFRVFVLMSDGECNEGSVWEAALSASALKLQNLVAIVDYNKWQATGRSEEVMALAPLCEKWGTFGWSAHEVDGHDLDALAGVMSSVADGGGEPLAIVAHTVKGKGVSFMEDDNNWHYRVPDRAELAAARKELGLV